MSESNIKFTSNIEPVNGDIQFDTLFQRKVYDIKALEKMFKRRLPLAFEQQRIFNSCSIPCEFTLEEDDLVFGSCLDNKGKRKLVCKCTNTTCHYFSDCREDNAFTDDELISRIENKYYKNSLAKADEFLKRAERIKKQKDTDEEVHIEITDNGLEIQPVEEKLTEKKIADIYSPIDSIVRLYDGVDISEFIQSNTIENNKRKPLFETWNVECSRLRNDMRICTAQTMQIIKAFASKEKKKLNNDVDIKEELDWARNNGKHSASGYDFINSESRKNTALMQSVKINHEYEELSKSFNVQLTPLDRYSISFGSKVKIKDSINQNIYSFSILGKEDYRFLNDYKIIPYTTKVGSAFYGLHIGDNIKVSFNPGEDYHICEVIEIEISDYLYW